MFIKIPNDGLPLVRNVCCASDCPFSSYKSVTESTNQIKLNTNQTELNLTEI